MFLGVIIENGPTDWQIIQKYGDAADIQLSGSWYHTEKNTDVKIFARLVREDTGDTIIPWTECECSENSKWQVVLSSVPAGGLYRIETCLNHAGCGWAIEWAIRGDMIHHIGVGDIYLIAGQSNSAGYGKDPIYDPPELGVHLLKNSGKWDLASHPLNESTNTVHEENRESANPGHSPYLHFAKLLKNNLGYPIGLIQAALGGSPLSAWNPGENGILYASMIKTIKCRGQKVKGMLWYQGCSDAAEGTCDTYLERFKNMVNCLRKDLKNDSLPILTVQLNRLVTQGNNLSDQYWGKIREAQRQAQKCIKNVFVIPAADCGLSDLIHNSSSANMLLGERLAKMALANIYGKKYICQAPDIGQAFKVDKNIIQLHFNNVHNRLYTFEVPAGGLPFSIIDSIGKIEVTSYELTNRNVISLTLSRDMIGKAVVHGAYEQNPRYILPVDIDGHLPMLSFYGVEIN